MAFIKPVVKAKPNVRKTIHDKVLFRPQANALETTMFKLTLITPNGQCLSRCFDALYYEVHATKDGVTKATFYAEGPKETRKSLIDKGLLDPDDDLTDEQHKLLNPSTLVADVFIPTTFAFHVTAGGECKIEEAPRETYAIYSVLDGAWHDRQTGGFSVERLGRCEFSTREEANSTMIELWEEAETDHNQPFRVIRSGEQP